MSGHNREGLTLLEVTIVVLITVTVSTMAVMKFLYVIERARAVEAVNVLRDIKNTQLQYKAINGEYVGDGNIKDFPKLSFNVDELEYFDRVEITTDPLNVGKIYRSNRTYHLNITDLGVVYCEVDMGSLSLCDKLGFKDVEFRKITEIKDPGDRVEP